MIYHRLHPSLLKINIFFFFTMILLGSVVFCRSTTLAASGEESSSLLTLARKISPPQSDSNYLTELKDRARKLSLHEDPTWLVLLHFQTWPGSESESTLSDPRFFLSEQGRTRPDQELDATLNYFFADTRVIAPEDQHAQCRFAARYSWLKNKLDFDPQRLPPHPCPSMEEWRQTLAPSGISLIFSEAYMNNPSSMFGHTLLRLDSPEQGEGTGMLGYAENFAANTGDDGGLVFIWKGLAGGYMGTFSLSPYYDKITEYSDWENRDIWEYSLNVAPANMDLLLRHLWEMRRIEVPYYFFTRNCSYELLGLLEVAIPGTGLQKGFFSHAIPVDTIRAVTSTPGLVRKVRYRPSPGSRLRKWASDLSPGSLKMALHIANTDTGLEEAEFTTLPDTERARILDFSYQYLRFRFLDNKLETKEAQPRSHRILTARSRIEHKQLLLDVPSPDSPPDQGHLTARLALGVGWKEGRPFQTLRIRPALHDILDPQGGFTPGAQINFLDMTLRYEPQFHRGTVESLNVLDILSLTPMNRLFSYPSWRLQTAFERRNRPEAERGDQDQLVWRSQGGGGITLALTDHVWGYFMGEIESQVADALRDHYALGAGPHAGVYFRDSQDQWSAQISAQARFFFLGESHDEDRVQVELSHRLSANDALRVLTYRGHEYERKSDVIQLSWVRYF
ncbi:MAG: hypothetical protein HW380_153 [Magnetococcales bacterium]|nr:hypothetical protein [Magnetococcales bacterium]